MYPDAVEFLGEDCGPCLPHVAVTRDCLSGFTLAAAGGLRARGILDDAKSVFIKWVYQSSGRAHRRVFQPVRACWDRRLNSSMFWLRR
jgi:hypothetical protein